MSKQTDKSLFIGSSMPGLYQQILTGVVSYEALGKRILSQIKTAHAFRQVEQVRELARILINIPIREYQLIAQYYLVWCKCREYEYPAVTLERIIEQSQTYKTHALISRAAFEVYKNKPATALYFYTEALKTTSGISEYIGVMLGSAVIKGIEGFHASAIKDMENLLPLVRHAEPQLFFNFHNSYATELATVGRTLEANNLSDMVMASPFAPYYPEWQSTFSEIRSSRKSRSTITISPPQKQKPAVYSGNVLQFPAVQETSDLETVFDLSELADTTITPLQLLGVILKLVLKNRITDEEVDRICSTYYKAVNDMWSD